MQYDVDGDALGLKLGLTLGDALGLTLGLTLGDAVGDFVGADGIFVGSGVGVHESFNHAPPPGAL